jgi:hypothetical protein
MVTMKDIQQIRDDLKKCKPADMAKNSEKPLSVREAVRHLAPTLLKMRKQGFSTSALVELLQAHQITIKGRDLSRYLRDFQGDKAAKAGTVQAQNLPAPADDSATKQ